MLEIHFIELPKFCKEELNIKDALHRWLMFLGEPKEEVLEMLEAMDNKIGKAAKVLNFLSSDPETVRLSELREKAIWDEVSRMNGAKAEGRQQGIQEGIQQGIQEGMQQGIQEGMQQGIQEGMQAGIQQGTQQGIQQGQINIARRMLAKGLDIEDIAELAGLSVEEIEKLKD